MGGKKTTQGEVKRDAISGRQVLHKFVDLRPKEFTGLTPGTAHQVSDLVHDGTKVLRTAGVSQIDLNQMQILISPLQHRLEVQSSLNVR
jgi:hypothetical protein